MVNQKGEFPLDAKVSARVKGSTKRLLKKLKQAGHTEGDVIDYAATQLAKEPILLEWEIGELDIKINFHDSESAKFKALKQAKMNRLRCIAPNRLDDETLQTMLVNSAREYAQEIFDSHGESSLEMLEKRKNSVKVFGNDLGYDELEFLNEVRDQLKIICQTNVSDI